MSQEFKIIYDYIEQAQAQALWQELEPRAKNNFFLSWHWMSIWLETYQPDYKLLQVWSGEKLVGLGFFTLKQETRHKFITSNVLRLSQTGNALEDQIWIEYNSLLTDKSCSEKVIQASMDFLVQQNDWDEFYIGAIPKDELTKFSHTQLTKISYLKEPAFEVKLHSLRETNNNYLSTLSRNTRYQINRTKRLYDESGELNFHVTNEQSEIESIWHELGELHKTRWGTGKGESGFANDLFIDFHKALIAKNGTGYRTDFCILKHKNKLIGCLYNFVYKDRVYFYLSGIRYDDDARLKPGLLLHALAIQYYLDSELGFYDFMGGDSRYKRSLAKQSNCLFIVSLQKPSLALVLERIGKKLFGK